MSQEKQEFAFADLLLELSRLCTEQRTGLVMIRARGSGMARINLEQGEIVFVSLHDKRGTDALPLLKAIDAGKLDFIEGVPTSIKSPLPPTHEIFATLADRTSDGAGKSATTSTSVIASKQILDGSARTVLEEALADHVGPMAALVCENNLLAGQDLKAAINILAEKIPDSEHARQFITEVQAKLLQ